MDRHFRFAEPAANVPLVTAFADRLYVEQLGCQTRAVFGYDERLHKQESEARMGEARFR